MIPDLSAGTDRSDLKKNLLIKLLTLYLVNIYTVNYNVKSVSRHRVFVSPNGRTSVRTSGKAVDSYVFNVDVVGIGITVTADFDSSLVGIESVIIVECAIDNIDVGLNIFTVNQQSLTTRIKGTADEIYIFATPSPNRIVILVVEGAVNKGSIFAVKGNLAFDDAVNETYITAIS